MPLASSSLVQVTYIAEATFGVIPGAGNARKLRITGESLNFDVSKESSKEINSTRTVSSVTPTTASANGGVNGEMTYQEWDTLMAATLQSTWTVFGTNGVQGTPNTTTAATATTLTASPATSGLFDWSTLQKGQWFRFVHPTFPNDGKLFRVSSSVAPTTTVITLDAGTPAAVHAASAGGVVQARRLTHGITQTSFTIQRQNADITQFLAYTGMTPSKMTVQVQSASISSINFDFMGKSATRAGTTQMPGTDIASYAFEVQSGVSGSSCAIWEGGAPITGTFVKSVQLTYDNALRSQEAICTLGAVGIGSGTINLTGTLSVYFADGTLFDKFKNNTNSSISFSSIDTSGNGYVFTLPVINITSWKVSAGAKDQDMMCDINFTALRDAANVTPALQKAIFIDSFGVATS